jgi:tetratricopeptide (TPR) repeat protein
MKAEKRKELESNTLAKSIVNMAQRFKEKPGQASYIIGGFVLLAIASVAAWLYFRNERAKTNSKRWESLAEAVSEADLKKIIDESKDSPAGKQARLMRARSLMAQAQPALYRPDPLPRGSGIPPDTQQIGRSAALDMLGTAEQLFEQLAPEYGDLPLVAQECYMSAATIKVSLEKFDDALKLYRELAKKYPNSEQGKEADRRAKRLEDKSDRAEIEEFVKNLPHPRPLGDGTKGSGSG